MQIYGYHRTSTKEQHLDRGIQEIERYCNEHEMALTNIFTDQETGKNFNRPRYTVLVEDVLRPGDILIVTAYGHFPRPSGPRSPARQGHIKRPVLRLAEPSFLRPANQCC